MCPSLHVPTVFFAEIFKFVGSVWLYIEIENNHMHRVSYLTIL